MTATRTRLRAVRRQLVDDAVSAATSPERPAKAANHAKSSTLPYTWHFVHHDGLWTLVVRSADGRTVRVSYNVARRPSDADGARIARRVLSLVTGKDNHDAV